ncbi:MAG: 3-isopropylmalate dehydratase large subunit [Candidatus Marinimicrobia bacterium]|nr:3-isopropylmalate dehydratase large subunit [Candidatus Neomarinimicrobiota bacterium]MCF7830021.1 3-isopropylmalate dehydratase large subunit [Candidatus Neomarinimicrobiota bacterium]MCF7881937.1 3-isopropylmalate dehydratase large subunit [Candidatus Neomarinimicrobiota bacterium]
MSNQTNGSSRSQTFVQKVLARGAGQEYAEIGEVVDVTPDRALSHDNSAAIRGYFESLGVTDVWDPEKLAITLDHAAPAPTVKHAENHSKIREFVKEQGISHFFEVGRGICHQVLSEEALILPGQIILGADSHTPHFGWMGAFGTGIGRSEMAATWAAGELWLRVPETIRVRLTGELSNGATSKDVALSLIGQFGADGALYKSVEFTGDGVSQFTVEDRMVLINMMAEFGAKNAYLEPDESVFDWLAARLAKRTGDSVESCRQRIEELVLYPDEDAEYDRTIDFDLSEIEPVVAKPHTVDNVVPLSEMEGTRVHQAYIGTCTNGRLSDIAAAAEVLRGKRISPNTRLMVVPASSEVLEQATDLGYTSDLVKAGAVISPPGCGACMGNHMGVLAPGEVCISSANRNFQGRMGTRDAEIYLANPAVVAASALAGYITNPENIKEEVEV